MKFVIRCIHSDLGEFVHSAEIPLNKKEMSESHLYVHVEGEDIIIPINFVNSLKLYDKQDQIEILKSQLQILSVQKEMLEKEIEDILYK